MKEAKIFIDALKQIEKNVIYDTSIPNDNKVLAITSLHIMIKDVNDGVKDFNKMLKLKLTNK